MLDIPQKDIGFLSTPSARRATHEARRRTHFGGISIHALREEGDLAPRVFKPRAMSISIHALREEGDLGLPAPYCCMSHFYPRPPRGGRQSSGNIRKPSI